MKRPFLVVLLVLACVSLVVPAVAAPLQQEQRPLIAQPEQDTAVRGVVQVVGTATHPQFQRYELYYAPWPVPSDQSWVFVGDAHFQQQPLGLLGTWDSRSVPDGTYGLRIRVVKQDGNYIDSDPLRVLVANTRPAETATPSVTDTPTIEPTPMPATATIVVQSPMLSTATVAPTATPEPDTTPILGTPGAGSGTTATDVGKLLDGDRLKAIAKKAALYTAGGFAAVLLFFGLKALLAWLWHRVRP